MEKFVVLSYFEYTPVQVYGLFDSEQEAHEWAQSQAAYTTYGVNAVLDINQGE